MNDIILNLKKEILRGEATKIKELVKKAIDQGLAPLEILEKALRPAMEEVGKKFEDLEIFLPDMMKAAEAMTAGTETLRPYLGPGNADIKKGLILLGTVEGDVHEIGKNIVRVMLEGVGFKVIDLGYNVPVLTFVEKVKELNPDILGMSALMTTTMVHMPRVIKELQDRDLKKKVKIIVGGAPVLPDWAEKIGADGYGENAGEAVNLVRRLVK
ncbi:MAG TPA: cobalamin-binding protein [Candidatus Aminicenantes bacterium]|nr:cobalamin-binding protein [Candidatus Aminicenantes bacterium]